MLTSDNPMSMNLSRKYSARFCSPNGLAGIEQISICCSVISSAWSSKNRNASRTVDLSTRSWIICAGEIFSAEVDIIFSNRVSLFPLRQAHHELPLHTHKY